MQHLCQILLISPMSNICTRFAQDCSYFYNEQYMHKICTGLYLFLQCIRFAQDCTYFSNGQHMCKIRAILYLFLQCAKYEPDLQDSNYFSNVQYMCKICSRLYLFPQCTIYAQDLCKIVLISPMSNISTRFPQDYTYF